MAELSQPTKMVADHQPPNHEATAAGIDEARAALRRRSA